MTFWQPMCECEECRLLEGKDRLVMMYLWHFSPLLAPGCACLRVTYADEWGL